MNPLSGAPRLRQWIYRGLWATGGLLVGAQVAVGSIDDWKQPAWLTAALAVYPAIASYVGYQADRNTDTE